MILRQRDLRTVGVLAMTSIGIGAFLLTLAIGWHGMWLGAIVAIPGGLLASALYVAWQRWTSQPH